MNKFVNVQLKLCSLSVYSGLLEKEPLASMLNMLEAASGEPCVFARAWGKLFSQLCACSAQEDFAQCIAQQILYDDNPFSRACAGGMEPGPSLFSAAQRDLLLLREISQIEPRVFLIEYTTLNGESRAISLLPVWNRGSAHSLAGINAVFLSGFYKSNGCGEFARHHAFIWRHGIVPVEFPDEITLDQLKGYEYPRGRVLENTKAFLSGTSANNCLLYGDRGTGKSSTVKAILNEYHARGLRMIEMPKSELGDFSALAQILAKQPLKFIIFIDDLSFSANDDSYAALKAILEGGIASKPDNTVIYATTNRRHLIKENFSDRNGDDVHFSDTLQESLSLADRFGLTVTFQTPDKERYLQIVRALASDSGLEVTKELEEGAERFALERSVRSPRCARQYIDMIKSNIKI